MSKKAEQTGVKRVLAVIIVSLFYLISCSSEGGTSPTPTPSQGTMDHIKALTLEEVAETSISVSWDLLRNEVGAIDYKIDYTVYAETHDGNRFTKDPNTETAYTLLLVPGPGKERLPEDDTGNRTGDITVSGLTGNSPYRIVVEAKNTSGNSSRSHILVYTASQLTDTAISDTSATVDDDRVTVTWDVHPGAQGYLLQDPADVENQLGEGATDDIVIVCPPGSLLCQEGRFAQEEGDKLKYEVRVEKGTEYKLVVVPFNFQDLAGVEFEDLTGQQTPDEQGLVEVFTKAVLKWIINEDSILLQRWQDALVVADSIIIYGALSPPKNLSVDFSRGVFTNIGNKLYAVGYPLTYESGGSVGDVSYHYRYRVAEENWGSYAEITDEAVIDLQVSNLSDVAAIQAGYGEKYQVEVIASNAGGFVSEEPATLTFTYKSFPEPFAQSDFAVVTSHQSLTVTWPEATETHGSTVSSYTVLLKDGPYRSPVQSSNTSEMNVVFNDLANNQDYYITVIPNGEDTGNIFTALSLEITNALTEGSEAERILTNYTGDPVPYTPQGTPKAVVDLTVVPGTNLAAITWRAPTTGSPATVYVVEYLKGVTTPISNIDSGGDAADVELSELSWDEADSEEVAADDTRIYSHEVSGLNMSSATNVFRVRAVHVDGLGQEWLGDYRYYALGTEPSRAPNTVGRITFSKHVFFNEASGSFTVHWSKPNYAGQNRDRKAAQLDGYLVSWETDAQEYGQSNMITDTNTLFYEITGLTPGTQYHVRVQAKNDNTAGYIYNVGEINSTYTIKPPGEVGEITYSEHTTNGFTVSWDAVDAGFVTNGPASVTYLIDWKDQGGDWNSFTRSNYSNTTEALTNLNPGTAYQVRVTATNGFRGNSREGGETWTLSLPEKVAGLKVNTPTYSNTTHTGGFTVEWTASDTGISSSNGTAATITNYEIAYAVGSDVKYASVTNEGSKTEYKYVFTDLKPNAEYQIHVRAQTVVGTGPAADVFGWVPSPPGKVNSRLIEFANATANAIDITWDAPEPGKVGGASSTNATTRYKVVISNDNGEWYTEVVSNYDGTRITATDLSQLTEYRVLITAMNVWGEELSISSDTGSTTDTIPPPELDNLQVDFFSANQVDLSWTAPTEMGIIDGTNVFFSHYVVKYKKSANTNSPFTPISHTNKEGVRLTAELTATSTDATVIGLSPDTAYTFLVAVVNSGNVVISDKNASKVVVTTKSAPKPPGNLKQGQCDKPTSADLVWDTSAGATSYKVYRDGIEITSVTTTSYTDTGLDSDTSYTYKVRACSINGCSDDSNFLDITTLKITLNDKSLKSIIEAHEVPAVLSGYDERSREIFSHYKPNTCVVAKYLKPGVGVNGDGSSFSDAAGNLKTVLEGITGSANRVYAVFLTGGTYQAGDTMNMKNHVAIIGGVDEDLGFSETATVLDGDNSYRVFNNNSLDNTALFYGVTITNGKAEKGAGMFNTSSTPRLVRVIFSGNTASEYGGGMYNANSSLSLERVVFSGNTVTINSASYGGGGMYNWRSSPILVGVAFSSNTGYKGGGMQNDNSSPTLDGVTFSGNTAKRLGGGIFNEYSSPILVGVTFSENRSDAKGGGMYNWRSSPILLGVTFSGNAADEGGGIYNDNDGRGNPLIVNGIFWGNTATTGPQFHFFNEFDFSARDAGFEEGGPEKLRIYNSIVQDGTGNLVSGKNYDSINQGGFVSESKNPPFPYYGAIYVMISFADISDQDPELLPLADNGGPVWTHAISSTSPAKDKGLYVKRKDRTFYYSVDDLNWYDHPSLNGDVVDVPNDAVYINATETIGYFRDKPDLGAYEAR